VGRWATRRIEARVPAPALAEPLLVQDDGGARGGRWPAVEALSLKLRSRRQACRRRNAPAAHPGPSAIISATLKAHLTAFSARASPSIGVARAYWTENMRRASRGIIWLNYADAGRKRKFLPNISAVAVAGDYLWTASDEMRTVECLEPHGRGYRLHGQFKLDDLFPGLPRAEKELEADVEALDVAHGRVWVCGSHSLTRRSRDKTEATVDPQIRERPSRRLLVASNSAKMAVASKRQVTPCHSTAREACAPCYFPSHIITLRAAAGAVRPLGEWRVRVTSE